MSKKIAIITHPLKNNYGGILQNYALQKAVQDMGHEVYTIDRLPTTPFKIKILSYSKRLLLRLTGKKVKLRGWQTKDEEAIINRFTRNFVNQHIKLTNTINSNGEVNEIYKQYGFDAYIVGSDQVWRRSAQQTNDLEFLAFLENNIEVKKIAYSASFGVSHWEYTPEETAKYKRLAQLFDAISVREESGVDLCKEYLGVQAKHLVDPTMLIATDEYVKLVDTANIAKPKGNMFCYVLDRNKAKNEIIDQICSYKKLTAFEVMPEQNFNLDNAGEFDINKCVFPKVESWIYAFMKAEFVVTDSFHGTVFSIIFNKPFISVVNKKRGAARFYSLLKMFNLENRLISPDEFVKIDVLNQPIVWEKVNKILSLEREKAYQFLRDALK